MGIITVTGREAATNADVLNSSRLQNIPLGKVKIEILANANDGTNNFTCSLALPSGEAPWIDIMVPGSNPALTGVIDDRQALIGIFDIVESGHMTLSVTETNTALLDWRVTSIS